MSLLDLVDVKKSFGSVEALRGVTFSVEAGSAVALVGDNGAGKSTLMKTITGVHRPDHGTIHFDGQPLAGVDPGEIRRRGIEMIYQDLALAKMQDVASNIFLGREPTRSVLGIPIIDRKPDRARGAGHDREARRPCPLRPLAGWRPVGRPAAVRRHRPRPHLPPKLVIMDEPTAALAVREIEHVLDLIRTLKGQGIAVILISHRLTDVFAVCDRIVALRQGQVIADEPTAETSMNAVVAHIVGGGDARLAAEHEARG